MKRKEGVNKADKPVLYKRDKGRCGAHVGGCDNELRLEDATHDEIIPKTYFNSRDTKEFDNNWYGEWNSQVMHQQCNDEKGGHVVEPLFRCRCHFLYIDVQKHEMHVLYRIEPGSWSRHIIDRGFIGDRNQITRGQMRKTRVKDRGEVIGWIAPKGKSQGVGLTLPNYTLYTAHRANMLEMIRLYHEWPQVVKIVAMHEISKGKPDFRADGYFHFNSLVAPGDSDSPRLDFAMPISEAFALADEGRWLVTSGWSLEIPTTMMYHWTHVEIDPNVADSITFDSEPSTG